MSIKDFAIYKEEIKLIQTQNPIECELYSVIAWLIRTCKNGKAISLRDVSARRKSEMSEEFYSHAGFPDFLFLPRVTKKSKPLGAIEVKRIGVRLDTKSNQEQLKLHIEEFEKVIYTNGIEWYFYGFSKEDEENLPIVLAEKKNGEFIWKSEGEWIRLRNKLDKCMEEMRVTFGEIRNYDIRRNR